GERGQAFGRLVSRHGRQVHALCLRILRDPEEARDAAQEAFARAFEASLDETRGQPRGEGDPEAFLPWILRIARNHCLDLHRRAATRAKARLELEVVDPLQPADDALAADQAGRALRVALATLPEPQREAIVLFHLEQLGTREVAQVLGVPQGTVLTWLHRGRLRLREELRRLDGEVAHGE
ncbi:MAG: RNA polymerase sigma factor, partial [Deltaproteobacteria bacterium]